MRRAAEVILGAHQPLVRCVIWDMSDGAARLAVAHPLADLPRTFPLVLFKGASVRRNCEVCGLTAGASGSSLIMQRFDDYFAPLPSISTRLVQRY
jgi:hypothetical protein